MYLSEIQIFATFTSAGKRHDWNPTKALLKDHLQMQSLDGVTMHSLADLSGTGNKRAIDFIQTLWCKFKAANPKTWDVTYIEENILTPFPRRYSGTVSAPVKTCPKTPNSQKSSLLSSGDTDVHNMWGSIAQLEETQPAAKNTST